jgi:group I intron endonuclease
MKYTIYKITNTINGKYYIGKHQTTNLNDGYMGSGKLLRRAINKYGRESFIKEILHVFQTEEEMNLKEKELVVISEQTYNLCEGGNGGFGYINTDPVIWEKVRPIRQRSGRATKNLRKGTKPGHTGGFKDGHQLWLGKSHNEETKTKISKANKGKSPWNKGKTHTEETKRKIAESLRKTG